jgi:hypothetical protein
MSDRQPLSPRTTIFWGVLTIGMGLFLVLMGFGVVKPEPRSVHGPLWIATVAGLVFMLGGLSIVVGALNGVSGSGELPKHTGWWMRFFYYALGLVACAGLAAIGTWVAFGGSTRTFGGSGMMLVPLPLGNRPTRGRSLGRALRAELVTPERDAFRQKVVPL